ncbi:hypothetical protein Ssi03_62920 [Sphaerisporangium siamense]|uniref:Tetratricopeptide (TPR) repeat protein n=1 Tax=Sphaerisporangium siamense TaxID=795645 RepID=A0A7W7D980_9ACTN|nr:XRE family transcriptional regulator [Sphaerisporangium siamense]MBB4702600.1 tetratricopeptide (TPR) repeat protein [Sphaerisporangium siamense]GII88302.1 hypothetical protein Ssi03_62920 [Sphaerisporangium siamense]
MARQIADAAASLGVSLPERESVTRRIKDWEAGRHRPKDPYPALYSRAFGVDEGALFSDSVDSSPSYAEDEVLTGFVEEVEPTKRREVLKLGLVSVAPEMLRRVLRETAGDAMEFTRRAGVTALGAGTLMHLEAVVAGLNRSYSIESPIELFSVARAYRVRVGQMIQGPTTLKQARELYVHAAWLSEMLAWLAHDLGDPLTAEAWAIDSFEHADQAGHDELCAWATDAMASIALYMDRPARAIDAARRGMSKASPNHPLAIRLRAQAARAHARLGQREECEELLRDAGQRYERLPARAPMRFSVDTGNLASFAMTAYPASSYIWLGDAASGDFEKAKLYAQSAISAHEALPDTARSPSREAIARIDLAIAMAALGAPDEATDLGRQALSTTRLVDSVRSRAGDLDRVLIARYPKLGLVQHFREAFVQMSRNAITT